MRWASIFVILAIIGGAFLLSPRKGNEGSTFVRSEPTMSELTLTSAKFSHRGTIPAEYTCDGKDISPRLDIKGVPADAKSLVLIMHDPDAPVSGGWTHWVVYNIPPTTRVIEEGKEPEGTPSKNSWGRTGYGGPCPPSGTHRYFFTLYALDTLLSLPEGSSKKEVEKAMLGHILAQTELIALYARK